jgi:hypothetical protein
VESLRALAEHLQSRGGRPLLCVFDRPKTIALKWEKDAKVRNGIRSSPALCWIWAWVWSSVGPTRRLLYENCSILPKGACSSVSRLRRNHYGSISMANCILANHNPALTALSQIRSLPVTEGELCSVLYT